MTSCISISGEKPSERSKEEGKIAEMEGPRKWLGKRRKRLVDVKHIFFCKLLGGWELL